MKVRHKDTSKNATFTVLEETAAHYVAEYHGCFQAVILLPKADFEPVPEPRWVNVTAECEVDEDGCPYHRKPSNVRNVLFLRPLLPGYRLVKKTLFETKEYVFGPHGTMATGPGIDAFIIEQQEP